MRWLSILTLASTLTLTGFSADPPKLVGEWSLTSASGGELAKQLQANVTRLLIDDETLTAGRSAPYTADEKTKTLEITIGGGPKNERGKYLGIYELTNETLKIHLALPGQPRPSNFTPSATSVLIVASKTRK